MDLSGIIFVVLALAWAVYLVPKALKHHDELARTRSVDRFSTAMRVLARREPVDRRSARLVVTPARSVERVLLPQRVTEPAAASPEPGVVPAPRQGAAVRRAAARAAARRRRRILLSLVVVDLVVVGVAAFALLPWWSVAVPVGLTLLYLVLCRTQVRREDNASWSGVQARAQGDEDDVAPRRAIRIDSAYGTPQTSRRPAVAAEFSADEDTVQIPLEALEAVAVPVQTVDGGSLWDPLPVTLPTYVGKARAARTVRTIDLGAPGAWTSGRDEADTALVEQAGAAEAEEAAVVAEQEARRAVGS